MSQIKSIVYGLGGYDERKPNNNIIEIEYYTNTELTELSEAEANAIAKSALLAQLGITEEQAKLLLS